MMSDVRSSSFSGAGVAGPWHSRGNSLRIGAASIERDVTANLKIVTKEGDTVTISAQIDQSATYASLRQRGHGGRVDAGATQQQSQSSLNVQVQGNLSPQEQADIAQVVSRFMHDLRALAQGKDVSVANVAGVDAQTLNSVTADSNAQTTITVVAAFGLKASMPGGPLPVAPVTPDGGAGPGDSPAQPLIGTDEGGSPATLPSSPQQARGMAGPLPVSAPPVLELVRPTAA